MDAAAETASRVAPPDAALAAELDLLAKAARILEIHGHGDRIFGHIAMRDPQGRGFWLKRHGIALGEVWDGRDFQLCDFDGKLLHGEGKRHSEWPIHAEILKARPDINFTAHTHPLYGATYSAISDPLPLLQGRRFGIPPRFEETSEFILTPAQGAAVAASLGAESVTVILRHHGVVFCGRARIDLITTGIGLEEACQQALIVSASSLNWSAPATIERTTRFKNMNRTGRDDDLWNYFCRVLKRAEEAGDIHLSTGPVG